DGEDHRHGSGARADPRRRRRRRFRILPARREVQRPCHRVPHQRGKSGLLPSFAGQDRALSPAGRTGRAGRFRRLSRLLDPALLRFARRQAHRARQDARRMPDAAQARARRIRHRRHRDHLAAVPRAGARKGRHRRRLPHSLARGVFGPRRDGGIAGITAGVGAALSETPIRISTPGWRRMRLAREPLPWHVRTPYLRESSPPRKRSMANRETTFIEITPEVLLKAYACGIFPMAESAEDPALYWLEPEMRGVIPLERFHMPGRLTRTVRSHRFTVTANRDLDAVLQRCAEPRPGRPRTWINERIRVLYRKLYERRHCHSLEVYEGEALVGGLYGVTLGRAFFGESMFHRARDASKVALVHLVARLKAGGFK